MTKSKIVTLARNLCKNQTDAEGLLWSKLRSHQIEGYKFKRQVPFGDYVLDFYCRKARLAFEIDSGQHADPENISTDEIRTRFLNEKGIKMLRFWNHEVLRSLDDVVDEVLRNIKAQQDNEPG